MCSTMKKYENMSDFFLNKELARGRKQSVKKPRMKGTYFYSTCSSFTLYKKIMN